MKDFKRYLVITLVVICLGTIFVPYSFAANTNYHSHIDTRASNIDDNRFTYEWEHTKVLKVGGSQKAKLVYGFDMFWTDEDYAWTMGEYRASKAGVKRADDGSGTAYDTTITWASQKDAGVFSKCERPHTTNNVYYYNKILFDYSSYGEYTYTTIKNTNYK